MLQDAILRQLVVDDSKSIVLATSPLFDPRIASTRAVVGCYRYPVCYVYCVPLSIRFSLLFRKKNIKDKK